MWPEVKLVRGSSRHSESNGGVERANQTVEKKLGKWMKDNNSRRWSIGCKIIQWQINTSMHLGIKAVPYRLTYGQKPRVGISNLPLDPSVLDALATEADLNNIGIETSNASFLQEDPSIPPPAGTVASPSAPQEDVTKTNWVAGNLIHGAKSEKLQHGFRAIIGCKAQNGTISAFRAVHVGRLVWKKGRLPLRSR